MIASLFHHAEFLQMFGESRNASEDPSHSRTNQSTETTPNSEAKPIQFVASADLLTRIFTLPLVSLVERTKEEKEESAKQEQRRRQAWIRKERVKARGKIGTTRQNSDGGWSSSDQSFSSLDYTSDSSTFEDFDERGNTSNAFPSFEGASDGQHAEPRINTSVDHRDDSKWIRGHPSLCVRVFRNGNVIVLDDDSDLDQTDTERQTFTSSKTTSKPTGKILQSMSVSGDTTTEDDTEMSKLLKNEEPRFRIDDTGRIEILPREGTNPQKQSQQQATSILPSSTIRSTPIIRTKESESDEGSGSDARPKKATPTPIIFPTRIETPAGNDSLTTTPNIFRPASPHRPLSHPVALPVSMIKPPPKKKSEAHFRPVRTDSSLHNAEDDKADTDTTTYSSTISQSFIVLSPPGGNESASEDASDRTILHAGLAASQTIPGNITLNISSDQLSARSLNSSSGERESRHTSISEGGKANCGMASSFNMTLPTSSLSLPQPPSPSHLTPSPASGTLQQTPPQQPLQVQHIPFSSFTTSVVSSTPSPLSTTSSSNDSPNPQPVKRPLLKVNENVRFVAKPGGVNSLPPVPSVIPTHSSAIPPITLNIKSAPQTVGEGNEGGWEGDLNAKMSVTAKSFVPRFPQPSQLNTSLPPSLQPTLPSSLQPTLPSSLPSSLPSFLPSSLPTSLPTTTLPITLPLPPSMDDFPSPTPQPKLKTKPKSLLPKPKDFHSVPKCVEQLPRHKDAPTLARNSPLTLPLFPPTNDKPVTLPPLPSLITQPHPIPQPHPITVSFPKPQQTIQTMFLPNNPIQINMQQSTIPPRSASPPFMKSQTYNHPVNPHFQVFAPPLGHFGGGSGHEPLVVISKDGNDVRTDLFENDGRDFDQNSFSPSFLSEVMETKSQSVLTFGQSTAESFSLHTSLSPPRTPPSQIPQSLYSAALDIGGTSLSMASSESDYDSELHNTPPEQTPDFHSRFHERIWTDPLPPSAHSPTFGNHGLSPPNFQLLRTVSPGSRVQNGLSTLEKDFWNDWNFGTVGKKDPEPIGPSPTKKKPLPPSQLQTKKKQLPPSQLQTNTETETEKSSVDDESTESEAVQPAFTLLNTNPIPNLEEKFFFRTAVQVKPSPKSQNPSLPYPLPIEMDSSQRRVSERLTIQDHVSSSDLSTVSTITPPPTPPPDSTNTPSPIPADTPTPIPTTAAPADPPSQQPSASTPPSQPTSAVTPPSQPTSASTPPNSTIISEPAPVFRRTLLWELKGMNLVIGSNRNVFTGGLTNSVASGSLHMIAENPDEDEKSTELRFMRLQRSTLAVKLIDLNTDHSMFTTMFFAVHEHRGLAELIPKTNALTASLLSLFVENVLNGIQTTVICFHSSGVVEDYVTVDTDEIPTLHTRLLEKIKGLSSEASTGQRSSQNTTHNRPESSLSGEKSDVTAPEMMEQGVHLLEQLERRCSDSDGVHWLVMMKGSNEMRLVDRREMTILQQQRKRLKMMQEERRRKRRLHRMGEKRGQRNREGGEGKD
ncbi:hypothetical protein BLNAU_1314 [Blattamonas nauphoetae]|uniref:Uncharacterized protein n=1 Tax=Blattamonas nauphoetae TaxID=2049346 RepID=A0ABQ9YJ31_9EUKA|nr:hypothetical protein BLNAU_1314 [Blattamonas nauphoetae]